MDRVSLINGAGAGIGAELTRMLLERGETVVASPRNPDSPKLKSLKREHGDRIHMLPVDVTDETSIRAAVQEVGRLTGRVDILFNNAGIYPKDRGGVDSLYAEPLMDAYRVNAVAPLRMIGAFLPLLRKGKDKRLIQVTSLMGSIEDNTSGGSYAYRMSKTALNMATRNLAHELGPEGFVALAIHPGWVQTRMGGAHAPLELGPASAEVLRVALETPAEENGGFFGPGGNRLPF